MQAALDALNTLKQGNERFVTNARDATVLTSQARRAELIDGQKPFAIILGCSDSRVPAEHVFDQGFGDLFVIRVAGNVVAQSQLGSLEFAVQQFNTPLIVVLGHSNCGAIKATLAAPSKEELTETPNLCSIVDCISPAIASLKNTATAKDGEVLLTQAIRANVSVAADQIRHGCRMLEERVNDQSLLVVGAEYSLETGIVDFFDGIPG